MTKIKTQSDTQRNAPAGNTKSRAYCLTINNYLEHDTNTLLTLPDEYCFQYEKGENGTKHIQAIIYFKNARSFDSIKKAFPRAHIEKTNNIEASIKYCSKKDTREGMDYYCSERWRKIYFKPEKRPIETITEFKDWHMPILEKIKEKADYRTINWIVDEIGNTGKTSLCKWLCLNKNALYIDSGKKSDIGYALANWENLDDLIILFDFSRDKEDYVSYSAMEQLKNGMMLSTKYETKMLIFNSPHIFVFSNFYPDTSKLSQDRWNITVLK